MPYSFIYNSTLSSQLTPPTIYRAEFNVQSYIISATSKPKHRNGSEEATLEARTELPQLPGRGPLSDLLNPDTAFNTRTLSETSGRELLDLPSPPSLSKEHQEVATREDVSVNPQRLAGELGSQGTSHEAHTKLPVSRLSDKVDRTAVCLSTVQRTLLTASSSSQTEMSSTEFGEYVRNLKRRPSSTSPEQRVAVERMITEAKRARALERSRLHDKPEEEVVSDAAVCMRQ